MRKGFGLITAIIILVLVSTLMALMMSLSATSVKQTSDLYFKEQAELLSRSAAEYGLLAISGHDNSVNCLENINLTYGDAYNMSIEFYYIYDSRPTPSCGHILADNIATNKSTLTTIMDVKVEVDQAVTGITEPIVIQRRTIQKP